MSSTTNNEMIVEEGEPNSSPSFNNFSSSNNIATFDGDEKAKATDFANYFCAYAQLYHQKQMLTDHNRMAAYHAAIVGNSDIFKDKVVMDVGTGSGILAVWAAQAGAKRVYAIEYTDMAKHAQRVVDANGVGHIVTVIQGAVEEVVLPQEDWDVGILALGEGQTETNEDGTKKQQVVDIILSEWMGYFLLRESMLDSLVRARDIFLKPTTGLMMPSHATMLLAPISDEEERKVQSSEYANAMEDWKEFAETTQTMYGVDMSILEKNFDREQKEYYVLSSRWAELGTGCLLAEAVVVKEYDMHVCTVEDARGVGLAIGQDEGQGVPFDFDIVGRSLDNGSSPARAGAAGPISGFAGWFTVDFKSRTDEVGRGVAPEVPNPAYLSTGPEMGYTHWGQQVFHIPSPLPLLADQTTRINGTLEMMRTKESARLYNVRIRYETARRKTGSDREGEVLMKGKSEEFVYQMP
eukprot:CAMPEP_0201867138 /NCGR_PEP_ID=MMETSP0902-20130614/1489_1 /ASSEMBLY_ACC=CAM_ASM_000551 /TAXON_ID=420261 /ORGANISM="Thalassiosira antarctica, Strain CCMP982" /LENGTH=464 /DNA_ID=CAMNT_0048392255 /DNA_START=176 /DNA_END=1570 /DNA_ORIENTATION=-